MITIKSLDKRVLKVLQIFMLVLRQTFQQEKTMSEHTPAPYRPRSVYGYALYIGSNMLFFLYLVWAVVPEEFLHEKLGLTYWPLKYWAVAIPIWAITAVAVFVFIIYPAINMLMTPDIDDIRTIRDQYSLDRLEQVHGGIPPVSDIPITEVSRKLYLPPTKINKVY